MFRYSGMQSLWFAGAHVPRLLLLLLLARHAGIQYSVTQGKCSGIQVPRCSGIEASSGRPRGAPAACKWPITAHKDSKRKLENANSRTRNSKSRPAVARPQTPPVKRENAKSQTQKLKSHQSSRGPKTRNRKRDIRNPDPRLDRPRPLLPNAKLKTQNSKPGTRTRVARDSNPPVCRFPQGVWG